MRAPAYLVTPAQWDLPLLRSVKRSEVDSLGLLFGSRCFRVGFTDGFIAQVAFDELVEIAVQHSFNC